MNLPESTGDSFDNLLLEKDFPLCDDPLLDSPLWRYLGTIDEIETSNDVDELTCQSPKRKFLTDSDCGGNMSAKKCKLDDNNLSSLSTSEQQYHSESKFWSHMYSILESYQDIFQISRSNDVLRTQHNLFLWICLQRYLHVMGLLAIDREYKLQQLVDRRLFSWNEIECPFMLHSISTGMFEELFDPNSWSIYFNSLLLYCKKNGSFKIPFDLMNENGLKLGFWLDLQIKLNQIQLISPDNSFLLTKLLNEYDLCVQYAIYPISLKSNSISDHLGNVSSTIQNSSYSNISMNSKENTSHDNSSLASSKNQSWMLHYKLLCLYGDKNGTCNVPYKEVINLKGGVVIRLGKWLDKQRQKQRKQELRSDREGLLQKLVIQGLLKWRISGDTSKDDLNWMGMFNYLLEYGAEFGSCNVPLNYQISKSNNSSTSKVNIKLGQWLNLQRSLYNDGNLRSDRFSILQSLVDTNKLNWGSQSTSSSSNTNHITISKDEARWNQCFEMLHSYANEHGHCNISQSYEVVLPTHVVKLGLWLHKQRKDKRKFQLRKDRELKLQELVDKGILKWNIYFQNTSFSK